MVIGNGLIASAFKKYKHNKSVIIFASGVSNSKEEDLYNFDREFSLLKNTIKKNKDKKIIYFSTCSIFDKNLSKTPYIIFKKKVEKYISENCDSFIVFRLPTVVGKTKNTNTLFNNFKIKLLNGSLIEVKEFSHRYLIDIDTLSSVLPFFIDDNSINRKKINVALDNKMLVKDILKIYEKLMSIKSNVVYIDGKEQFKFSNKYFMEKVKSFKFEFENDYNYKLLKKYLNE